MMKILSLFTLADIFYKCISLEWNRDYKQLSSFFIYTTFNRNFKHLSLKYIFINKYDLNCKSYSNNIQEKTFTTLTKLLYFIN